MGRPRKNRTGEYAGLLAEELAHQITKAVNDRIEQLAVDHGREVAALKGQIAGLEKKLEGLAKGLRSESKRTNIGHWVPGGPGRPPKDAEARVEAFQSRTTKQATKRTTRKKKKTR